jgi:hypothetical protein
MPSSPLTGSPFCMPRPHSTLLLTSAAFSCALLLGGCAPLKSSARKRSYSVRAHKPENPAKVRVKVSLSKQVIYVLEGDRLLMAAATCVGTPQKPTPKGEYHIEYKEAEKRSRSYGFFVNGKTIVPGEAAKPATGKFVGYPMGYWCEFKPSYGFHSGYVHPVPRTHGCLRLHKDAAPKFFALVQKGTPVSIQDQQPEDSIHMKSVQRPTDYLDPDPPAEWMVSSHAFEKPKGEILEP